MHHLTHIGIHKNRITGTHHTVHHNRISTILKIQIPADIIHNNKILPYPHVQMGDGLMKSQRMESPLLLIRDQPFHILERTGDLCLTMSFQNRHIDQKINLFHTLTDIQLHTAAVHRNPFILLHIPERHLILLFQPVKSTGLKSFSGLIPNPGPLQHHQIPESVLLQILNNSRNHLRMRSRTPGSLRRGNQIRLDPDLFLSVPDMGLKIRLFQKLLRHFFIFCTTGNKNLIFIHIYQNSFLSIIWMLIRQEI